MTSTTIKVSTELRDQLKRQAAARHRTLGAHLAYLAALGERETRMRELREAIKVTPVAQLDSYREETRAWYQIEDA